MTSPSRSGFTLIELLITIVVLVILLVMAAPSFLDTLERRRVINATQALSTHIQQARSVAIARNEMVSIVFRQTSTTDWCFGLTDGSDWRWCIKISSIEQLGFPSTWPVECDDGDTRED